MGSNELSSDISFERLPPASSVRPVPDYASKKDPESKSRRRPLPEDKAVDDVPAEPEDEPEHKIDSLA